MKDLSETELIERAQVPELIDLDSRDDHDWRELLLNAGNADGAQDRATLVWSLERPDEGGSTLQDPAPRYARVASALANGGGSPEDATRVLYACALAGWREAQLQLAAAFSVLAVDQRGLAFELGRRTPQGQPTPQLVQRLEYRAEVCVGLALGWGAVSAGRRTAGLPEDAPFSVQARAIGTDLLAMLGWRNRQPLGDTLTAGKADEGMEADWPSPVVMRAVCVVERITGAASFAKDILAGVRDIVGRDVPLVMAPDAEELRRIRREILAVFPHAVPVVDGLLYGVVPGRAIQLRPTLLLGAPGTGKSRLARLVLGRLGVPFATLDAGTSSDQAIVGSPRRWSHSYPSLPVTLMLEHGVANPGAILDEIEKAGRTSAGSLHDSLLGLLEPETSRRWRDQYLDAQVDTSHVAWIFTGNSIAGLPMPLLNRIRVLRMPPPSSEHLPVLARTLLREILTERLIDDRLELDLDAVELEAAAETYRATGEGSLRDLRRIVEAVLDARSMAPKH